MDQHEQSPPPRPATVNRRTLLWGGGLGAAAAAASALGAGPALAAGTSTPRSATLLRRPGLVGAPPVEGLHVQFGAQADSEVVVSWSTVESVHRPRLQLGTTRGGLGVSVDAQTRTYTDAHSGTEVYTHHARLARLAPGAEYVYAAVHDGVEPEAGTFRTAPRGRAPFTFTSFGDQATPTLTAATPAPSAPLPSGVSLPPFGNDALGSPGAADVVTGIERVSPLFNLINGDLCYANLSNDRVRVWHDWFVNNSRSARYRAWMPTAGNHENELGNGPFGFTSYQTRFTVPSNDEDASYQGLWYAFTAGSVRVVCINNDDVCYQDGGNSYQRGYSGGKQRAWLEKELAASRANRGIDWIVVCMHQVVISTVDKFNGADLGIREQFAPLFDKYGVDLVICGHEHHYERSHPVRGVLAESATLTPKPVATGTDVVDTSAGTVHMVLGGGGTSSPSNKLFFDPPQCRVITKVGAPGANGKRAPVYVTEPAPWSAVRDKDHPYGFARFDVDPGRFPGGETTITVTYYNVTGPGQITPYESFTLRRRRSDG